MFELDDAPAAPSRKPKPLPWRRLWINTFSAVFAAILLMQIINVIVGYTIYSHYAGKIREAANKPVAADVKK